MTSLQRHKNSNSISIPLYRKLHPPRPETSKTQVVSLKSLNDKIIEIFNSEYEYTFPSILTISSSDFVSTITSTSLSFLSHIYKNNELATSYAKTSITKAENIIKSNYSKMHSLLLKGYETYQENPNKVKLLIHYRKHCSYTDKKAYHQCDESSKSPLIQIEDEDKLYFVCANCKRCFNENSLLLYCNNCRCEYFSSTIPNNEMVDLQPATWAKYHCGCVVKEMMKCLQCKKILYFNLRTNMLVCLNKQCNFTAKPQSIIWNCAFCKKDFNSDAKVFNPNELNEIKKSIKRALLLKNQGTPRFVPCCRFKPELYAFYHKKDCRGVLYQGYYIKQKIIVCAKCYAMNFYDKFIWTCPMCKGRFKNDTEIEEDWRYRKGKRKISDPADMGSSRDTERRGCISAYCNKSSNTSNNDINYFNQSINDTNEDKQLSPLSSLKKKGKYNTLLEVLEEITPGLRIALTNRKTQSGTERELLSYLMGNREEEKTESRNEDTKISNFITSKSEYCRKKNCDISKQSPKKISINLFDAFSAEKESAKINNNKKNSPIKEIRKKRIIPIPKPPRIKEEKENTKTDTNSITSNEDQADQIQTIQSMQEKSNVLLKEILSTSKIPLFSMDYYKIIKPIGEGSFGKIYQIQNINDKSKFALKKIIAHDVHEVKKIQKEFELVYSHSHENIMKIFNIEYKCLDFSTYSVYVLMELANSDWNIEIKKRSEKKQYYKESELISILKQLVNALSFLQLNKVAHRDIKPQNVLLYSNSVYKVADFGEAKEIKISKQQNTLRGTELYMSPKLYNGLKANKKDVVHNVYKSDVFSLGYCFFYAASLNLKVLNDIRELKNVEDMYKVAVKYLGGRYSKKFWMVLVKMIEYDERKRVDFVDLNQIIKDNF